jgi:hypothetical protein
MQCTNRTCARRTTDVEANQRSYNTGACGYCGWDLKPYKTKVSIKQMVSISGRVVREDAEVIIIFKVQGKYYPATDHNNDAMDAYIHTGDPIYLNMFEKEVEL